MQKSRLGTNRGNMATSYLLSAYSLFRNRMATFSYSLFLFILLFMGHTRTNAQPSCETSCESPTVSIRFPFWLSQVNQSTRCGYPGFELTCNKKNQPLLNLPESGDFVVNHISHKRQVVWINDPDECLPRRIMLNRGFSLAGSPFQLGDGFTRANYSFFSCPNNSNFSRQEEAIDCLSSTVNNINYSVLAVWSDSPYPTPWTSSCHLISSALVPVVGFRLEHYWTSYNYLDIQLQWDNPDCGDCEERGGWCGFQGVSTLQLACYNLPGQGLSRKARYGISIGLGIPGLLVIIGFACFLHSRMRLHDQRRQARTQLSTFVIPHPSVGVTGLDGASIEKYPKTQLGESGRLPKPNDNICSICLCEYQPKEMLRTIPECDHYFHANCIDGWLKMNAACPLCRNLPGRSSLSSSSLPLSPISS